MTAKRPLAPGDVLVNDAYRFGGSEWRTALVIAINRGAVRLSLAERSTPASVTMLVSGPTGESIIERDFSWIVEEQWESLDRFDGSES